MEQARVFIDNLASTGENMLLNFDNFLTVDDVIKGRKSVRVFYWYNIKRCYIRGQDYKEKEKLDSKQISNSTS